MARLLQLLLAGAAVLFSVAVPGGHGLQLCRNAKTAPMKTNGTLAFCGVTGQTCCTPLDDSNIAASFAAMGINGTACGAAVKSVLCAACSPYSAALYPPPRSAVPLLCNSTAFSNAAATADFCTQVYTACSAVPIRSSPFIPTSPGASKLTDKWPTAGSFCANFGGAADDTALCFNGTDAAFAATPPAVGTLGMCLEKISNGSYINMVPHPDGSSRVFVNDQAGRIWLATLPPPSSGKKMQVDVANPFLDLTDEVYFDNEFGLLGLAFHPKFAANGRFFVSYSCDKTKVANCAGRCSCNADSGCDPTKVIASNGAQPCQFQSVIAEYTANSSTATPSNAKTANPVEVNRIWTMGLPYTTQHGGQILFSPGDGYMYFMMGNGGGTGDPWNFAQKSKTVLGKILRIDVDRMPTPAEVANLSLWGNYSIPFDNPFAANPAYSPEIFALGFKNPWRCSFDSKKPSYFFCGDVGQLAYEEVDLVTSGGNYGWRVYEGFNLYNPPASPGGNTSAAAINPIFPVMGYTKSQVNGNVGSASVTGGYVYRGTTAPCLYGNYIYADLYATSLFAGVETPVGSGMYNQSSLSFGCSKTSPLPCTYTKGSAVPSLGYIFSFAEDNSRDLFLLTSKGVYRVVDGSHCGYACPLKSTENDTASAMAPTPGPGGAAAGCNAAGAALLAFLAAVAAFFFV